MKKKIIGIGILVILVIALFSGCVDDEPHDTSPKTKIGIIEATDHTGSGNSEKTTILFEDGSFLTILSCNSLTRHQVYVKAKANIGNRVKIVYVLHTNGCRNYCRGDHPGVTEFIVIEEITTGNLEEMKQSSLSLHDEEILSFSNWLEEQHPFIFKIMWRRFQKL